MGSLNQQVILLPVLKIMDPVLSTSNFISVQIRILSLKTDLKPNDVTVSRPLKTFCNMISHKTNVKRENQLGTLQYLKQDLH